MGRSGVVRDGFSCWLLCLTDFHLPHPAALLYSALHLQRRMTRELFHTDSFRLAWSTTKVPFQAPRLLMFATIGIKHRQAKDFYHPEIPSQQVLLDQGPKNGQYS